jgi:hypothetical protein
VPAKNRVGCHNRGNVRQDPTTEAYAENSQASPFVVAESHALAAQLCRQDAVLFTQVLNDDVVLSALEPSNDGCDEQLYRNHAPSLRQRPGDVIGHYRVLTVTMEFLVGTGPSRHGDLMPERENFGRELEPRAGRGSKRGRTAMNSAVILPENGSSLWRGTATTTTRTEYSVGTGAQHIACLCCDNMLSKVM